MKKLVYVPALLSLFSSLSWSLDLRDLNGEKNVRFYSPRGVEEKCVVPQKWPGASYTDKDRKQEEKLCKQDFYKTVAVCPKLNSTNPGVLVVESTDRYTREQIQASCDLDRLDLKTESKFKQSLSCSYTPSILAYYHFSRLLDGAGRVPVNVIRTMDIATHRDITRKATSSLTAADGIIAKTWDTFANVHRNPGRYPKVVDETRSQIYGSLLVNLKGENIYTEVSGKGSYDTRYQRFVQQRPFLNVASSKSLVDIAGSRQFSAIAPLAVQMKDVSDMVLLDTLLNQQDRIGNIHFKFVWYIPDAQDPRGYQTKKSDADVIKGQTVIPAEEKQAMAAQNAVLVKEMHLKDNDCGVVKENLMAQMGALQKVRHMSYETYARFMGLAKVMPLPVTRDYLMREFLFDGSDYQSVLANSQKARSILYNNCKAGLLKFDVDLSDYLSGPNRTKTCDI